MSTTELENRTLQLRARLNESVNQLRSRSERAIPHAAIVPPPASTQDARSEPPIAAPIYYASTPPNFPAIEPVCLPDESATKLDIRATDQDEDKEKDEAKVSCDQPQNNRESYRKATVLAGKICNDGNSSSIDVMIEDLSATGARCRVSGGTRNIFEKSPKLSDYFQLYVTYDRMTVRCKLQWQHGAAFGVKYLAAPQFY